MGIHPNHAAGDNRHRRALERIVKACQDTGTAPGIACGSPEEAIARRGMGFRFLTAGSDSGFMTAGAMAGLKSLRA
jgi:2-keto-3-deoxy-L-rhamnonate aldolase RhmA